MTMLWVQKRGTLRGSKIRFFGELEDETWYAGSFFHGGKIENADNQCLRPKNSKKQPTENYYPSSSLLKKKEKINFTYF